MYNCRFAILVIVILLYNKDMNKNKNNTNQTSADNIVIPRAQYEALQAANIKLEQEISWLKEQLCLSKKRLFGASSEKAQEKVIGVMSSLFDEAELFAEEELPAEAEVADNDTKVAAHTRKKHTKPFLENLPEGITTEVVEHDLPTEERICKECGSEMQVIGKEVRKTLVIIPKQFKVREDWYYTYACSNCNKEGVSTPVIKTPKDNCVIAGSFASAEAVALIMTEKFVMGSPIYRLEQEFKRQGIDLSRQTMSNWVLKSTELWLKPLYDELHKRLLMQEVLHADETTLQVLAEEGRKATANSYMWLYRTSGDNNNPIVLYEYQPGRGSKYPQKFLEGFKGYLHTDGYAGYHSLSNNITVVGCLAHLRRKFDEAVKAQPKGKSARLSAAKQGLSYCNQLFKLEKKFEKLSSEKRYKERLKQEKPILDALLAWANTLNVTPKSALGKAIEYLNNQWGYLINYLKDGRLEISNNRAERSIKPFVIDRKNFLFAITPRGAQGSAIMFSLIETAKENGLNPYSYLRYIFRTAPILEKSNPNWVMPLLPENAPEECRIKKKK